MVRKMKFIWCYVDGEKLVEVIGAALENNVMVSEMKRILSENYSGHDVKFVIEEATVRDDFFSKTELKFI